MKESRALQRARLFKSKFARRALREIAYIEDIILGPWGLNYFVDDGVRTINTILRIIEGPQLNELTEKSPENIEAARVFADSPAEIEHEKGPSSPAAAAGPDWGSSKPASSIYSDQN